MKKYIILFLLFLNCNFAYSFGLGDETYYTPYGNEIQNWTGNTLIADGKEELTGLKKWYFYKGYILGECNCYPPYDNKSKEEIEKLGNYFVFDETSYQLVVFETELEWNSFLNQNDLKPKFWTRWHDGGDNTILHIMPIYMVLLCPIIVMLLISILIFVFKNRRRKNYFKISHVLAVMCVPLFILFVWILEQFPSSI